MSNIKYGMYKCRDCLYEYQLNLEYFTKIGQDFRTYSPICPKCWHKNSFFIPIKDWVNDDYE